MRFRRNGDVRSELILIGPLPPPVQGAAVVTAELNSLLGKANDIEKHYSFHVFNTSPKSSNRTIDYQIRRVFALLRIAYHFSIKRYLRASKVIVAVDGGFGLIYQIAVMLMCRLRGCDVFLYHHSSRYIRSRSGLMNTLCMISGRDAKHIVCCDEMRVDFDKAYPFHQQIFCVNNAAFVDSICINRSDVSPRTLFTFGFLSNLSLDKGLAAVIATLRAARRMGIVAKLLIGGPVIEDAADRLLQSAKSEFGDDLIILGPLSGDMKKSFFEQLDLFVFPSFYPHETQSLVIPEALAAGVPVVCSSQGYLSSWESDSVVVVRSDQEFHDVAAETAARIAGNSEFLVASKNLAKATFSRFKQRGLNELNAVVSDILTTVRPCSIEKSTKQERRIKYGAVLEQRVEDGGAFQQALNELVRLKRAFEETGDELIVLTFFPENEVLLHKLGLAVVVIKPNLLDLIFYTLKLSPQFNFSQKRLKLMTRYERRIKEYGVDVVVFLTQSKWFLLLEDTPFIMTVFDNCHREAQEFPEVRSYGEYERREWYYFAALNKAVLCIVDSDDLKRSLRARYQLDENRIVIIPFEPSIFVRANKPLDSAAVIRKYGISPGYLFYPAQFWPHKNHVTLLKALKILHDKGHTDLRLVLCGTDKGGRKRVEKLIHDYGLSGSVIILGFVPSEELSSLYSESGALVMSTYFGPTNLPPLEAWACGTPVIYPSAFKNQVGNAAALFDYDSPLSLAKAIEAAIEPITRNRLIEYGKLALSNHDRKFEEVERILVRAVHRLSNRIRAIS